MWESRVKAQKKQRHKTTALLATYETSGENPTGGNLCAKFAYVTLTTVRVHLFQIASFFAFYSGIIATGRRFVKAFIPKSGKLFRRAKCITESLCTKNEKNAFSGLLFEKTVLQYNAYLPVAQLDSASDSDSEGRRFESFRVGHQDTRKGSV